MTPVEMMRNCLQTYAGERAIGYYRQREPVYVKDLDDNDVYRVFQIYLDKINKNEIAMRSEWRNMFLKVAEEAIDRTLFGK